MTKSILVTVALAFALAVPLGACASKEAGAGGDQPAAKAAPAARVQIQVTEQGFAPATVHADRGKPTTFVFTRKTDATCARDVVIPTDAGSIKKDLPLGEPVEVAATFTRAGDVTYTCGMGHVRGVIHVE